jgi:ADP-ribose pyrophosphatase YjhB (NUDIX family)
LIDKDANTCTITDPQRGKPEFLGGSVGSEESDKEAALRELKEESGQHFDGQLIRILTIDDTQRPFVGFMMYVPSLRRVNKLNAEGIVEVYSIVYLRNHPSLLMPTSRLLLEAALNHMRKQQKASGQSQKSRTGIFFYRAHLKMCIIARQTASYSSNR